MQTVARAPFVFLFSGDSIGGKARRDGGILGHETVVDARRRFRSTGGNNLIVDNINNNYNNSNNFNK